jgi:epoxyqueuosine reductase
LSGAALSRWIVAACTRPDAEGGLGFTAAGTCAAEEPPLHDFAAFLTWINRSMHGSMAYMADQSADRLDPQRVLPGARSVVMVADQYHARDGGDDALAAAEADGTPRARIARYARGRDYHHAIKRRLHRLADALRAAFPGEEFRSFADTAPVLERRFAQRAGLGWLAKNAMLIHPQHGSYLLLGGFITTIDLPPLPESEQPIYADHCGTCTRCIDACPTGAIASQPLACGPSPRVDGSRCISYLTIEHEGAIAPDLAHKTGDWAFGCDVCQEVCPHNSPRTGAHPQVRSDYAPQRATLPLLEMAQWQQADRSLLTVSAMKRATAEMFRRNAAIALANQYRADRSPQALAALHQMRNDESALVRRTVQEGLGNGTEEADSRTRQANPPRGGAE